MPSEKHASKAHVSTLLGVLASVTLCFVPFVARAEDDFLRIFMDHARVLKLDRPVSKVILGNSDVADATVADARTIVLTARNFGTTNIVLLDADGNAILDSRILVSTDEANTVRVYRQTVRNVLSCTPNCEQRAYTSASSSTNSSAISN